MVGRDLMVGLNYSIYSMAMCLMIQGCSMCTLEACPPTPSKAGLHPGQETEMGPQIQALFWTLGPPVVTPSSRPSPSSCLNPEPVTHAMLGPHCQTSAAPNLLACGMFSTYVYQLFRRQALGPNSP